MDRLLISWVRFLAKRSNLVFAFAAILVAASILLIAFHLPLHSDFADLLPADAPSVRAAHALESRLAAKDTMLMLLVAPDAQTRAGSASEAIAGLQTIGADLIDHLELDDAATRDFLRAHRHLYVPLADLTAARDALARAIKNAASRANPLLVSLEDQPADLTHPDLTDRTNLTDPQLAKLREKERAAEEKLSHSAYLSADGKTQVIVIKTSFRATDAARDQLLQTRLDALAKQLRADHPSIEIGFTGGVTASVAEHAALLHGMLLSSLFVALLVVLVLYLHLRSICMLFALSINILAATLTAFGIAALTVGHLNAATAFLGAIIAGNGINYGILLVARFLEERAKNDLNNPIRIISSRDEMSSKNIANAIAGTLRPTLIASLAAAVAYGALAVTHFRGFAEFAAIGSLGMIVCWLFSFSLLPALLLRFPPAPAAQVSPLFGKLVLRVFAVRNSALVCTIAAVVSCAAAIVCFHYFAHDPFEYDMTQLRSQTADAQLARHWMRVSDQAFGKGLAGVAGQTYLAAETEAQIPAIVDALHTLQTQDPIVGQVSSILDAVPQDQDQKMLILEDLRARIDRVSPREIDLAQLRPPDDLHIITISDLPRELTDRLREKDGSIGKLISVRPGPGFDEWNGRDLIHFANALRGLKLDGGKILVAGTSLLFADVLTTIQRDGPLVTAVASLGLMLLVLAAAGNLRRAVTVLASTAAGSLWMIAACALFGLKINFLDFVALPITLGLGVDYAINLADRTRHGDPRAALRSTGGTVFVCSATTVIGYASLLFSDNLAIRGFGTASLIGELTCVTAALVLVPALLAVRSR